MKIESPLHAEHQLDQLAGQFEHWRQTRTHPGERFPQALWDQAVALAVTLPPSRVAKQLRLRLIDLKKQMATSPASPSHCRIRIGRWRWSSLPHANARRWRAGRTGSTSRWTSRRASSGALP